MDLNLVVLAGRLAAPPEHRRFESGDSLLRYLVTVRTPKPRPRVDVLPVNRWVDEAGSDALGDPGTRIWVAGAVHRRFWDGGPSRRSRLEVVAHQIELRDDDGEDRGFAGD